MNTLIDGVKIAKIDALDRGLQYGDGVFETIAVRNGQLLLWDRHMSRLIQGCMQLNIPAPDQALLLEEASGLCNGIEQGIIKIVVTRGAGGRGYRAPDSPHPTRIITRYPWPDYPMPHESQGVSVRLCTTCLGRNPCLAGIKHLNRLEQVLARSEWSDPGISEGLMLDEQGNVIEGTMSNIFLVSQNRLLTPDLSACGIQGVVRGLILDLARELGIEYEITEISLKRLHSADEIFLTNSVIGLWPVRELDDKSYNTGPITSCIVKKLANYLR